MIVGALGNVIFKVSSSEIFTLDGISRSRQARIAKHDILGSKPKLEFQGVDLADISFNIRLDAGLGVDIKKQMDSLDNIFINGLVADLVIGDVYYGEFLISGLDDDVKRTMANGSALVLDLSIQLQEYVRD